MDVSSILIVLPLLIIFSYLFDIFARRTKFPSVILLVFTGIIARFISSFYGYDNFAFLDSLVPVLGTIGLILIVLEAAIELEIKKEKTEIIIKGFLAALIILVVNIVLVSIFFNQVIGLPYPTSVIYAIPLSIISSAVAIPSATGLITKNKEFVVYESTFSDILGIMFFYYCIRQAEKRGSVNWYRTNHYSNWSNIFNYNYIHSYYLSSFSINSKDRTPCEILSDSCSFNFSI
jgi:Kef-type K+ transport system membrane component KefB